MKKMQWRYLFVLVPFMLACAFLDRTASEEQPAPTSTLDLEVAVFATQGVTPTVLPTDIPPTNTPTAVVGSGNVSATTEPTPSLPGSGGNTKSDFGRPDNVNPLTGLIVDNPDLLNVRPFLVRIGNDPEARPQIGIGQADIVYEELTEWWITRFTAIYWGTELEMIAPVRSARLISLQMAPQYQGALISTGGSDGVRLELSQSSIIDLDQLYVPEIYFYRENEGWQTRTAFDPQLGRTYLKENELDVDPNLRGFIFHENPDLSGYPDTTVYQADEVIIPYPNNTSEATWTYDPAGGHYLRSIAGSPFIDADGSQITTENVIVYFAEHQETDIIEDVGGATSVRIILNGRGPAWLLRDGQILKGNWETDGSVTPHFTFDDGQPMPLKPGQTWIQVVPLTYNIIVDGVEEGL